MVDTNIDNYFNCITTNSSSRKNTSWIMWSNITLKETLEIKF